MATWIDRTQTSGNRQIFTYSAWVKITGNLATYNHLATTNPNPGNWDTIRLDNNRKFEIICNDNNNILRTSRVFRDTNAWYHFVVAVDTTQSTATNRTKLYVNGVQETSFESTGYPPQNHNTNFNTNSQTFRIGHNTWSTGGGEYFNGLMSHVHWIDGTQYQASDFGSTDANGVWKIILEPSVTYGTNGFFIFKDSQSITDQSGNSNNFTVASGTLTKTEDNPSNVFATLNPLHIQGTTSRSITYGNTRFYTTTTAWGSTLSTLGFSSGKFYVEGKILTLNSSTGYGSMAIQDINAFGSSGNTNVILHDNNASAGVGLDYRSGQSNILSGGSTVSSNVGDFSNNDIIGMAIDMDNKALYIHKNGTYYQIGGVTGVPTSGASKTGAITIPASVETCGIGLGSYTSAADFCYNFGNGYFLSTAVSSAGTNASGNGIFEYDVPTGYTALSTKGLNL